MALSRRGLFRGIAGIIAAPAIVRVASLMPVRALEFETYSLSGWMSPCGAPTLAEIITMTLRRRARALADSVANPSPLLMRLKHGG